MWGCVTWSLRFTVDGQAQFRLIVKSRVDLDAIRSADCQQPRYTNSMTAHRTLTAGLVTIAGIGTVLLRAYPQPTTAVGHSSTSPDGKSETCIPSCSVNGRVDLAHTVAPIGEVVGVTTTLGVACSPGPPIVLDEAEIVLMIDHSYSMIHEADYLGLAKYAVQELLRGLVPGQHRAAAIAYKSVPQVLSLLSTSFSTIQNMIDGLTPRTELAEPSLYQALELVPYVLGDDRRTGVPVLLLILTEGDGEARDSASLAANLRKDGLQIYAIGFGDRRDNHDRLRRIAGHDDHFFHGKDQAAVVEAVRTILGQYTELDSINLELNIAGNKDLPIVPKSAAPAATEIPGGLIWRWSEAQSSELVVGHHVQALSAGSFPAAHTIRVRYQACPAIYKTVDLTIPDLLVLAPTQSPEPTPTAQPVTATDTPGATTVPSPSTTSPPEASVQPTSTSRHIALHRAVLPFLFRRPLARR